MTAINVFLKREKAILMTDGAIYTPQGLIVGFAHKAFAVPTLRAAVAVRGSIKYAPLLALDMASAFGSFDEMVEAAPGYFPRVLRALSDGVHEDLRSAQVIVVGWSESRNRPIGIDFTMTDDGDEFEEIDEWQVAPATSEEEDRNLNLLGAQLEWNLFVPDLDPIRHGVAIMEAQRRSKDFLQDVAVEEPISIVGGHILLTEVTRDGVQQRVVHRWNDVAGEMIEPEPFQNPATKRAGPIHIPAGLGRAERRRLEKLARKQNA